MTPEHAKEALARQLALYGMSATINRGPSSAPMSAPVTVHLVGFSAREIIGGSGIQEGDSKAIIPASDLVDWPSDGSGQCPRKGDWITVGGRNRIVVAGWPAPSIGGEVVRYEAQVR